MERLDDRNCFDRPRAELQFAKNLNKGINFGKRKFLMTASMTWPLKLKKYIEFVAG